MFERRYLILGLLLGGLLLGCVLPGLPAANTGRATPTDGPTDAPTLTPIPTGTPTRAPTMTPTAAPTATLTASPSPAATPTQGAAGATPTTSPTLAVVGVDLSSVRLRAQDLPGMFIPMDVSAFGIDENTLSQGTYKVENLDLFVSLFPPEYVFTFLMRARNQAEQAGMDALLDNPKAILGMIASAVGQVRDERVWPQAPDVGEQAIGLSAVVTLNDQNLQMETIVFRRDGVAVVVTDMYRVGVSPVVTLSKLADLLDTRLREALAQQ